jgi:hypothetical protein
VSYFLSRTPLKGEKAVSEFQQLVKRKVDIMTGGISISPEAAEQLSGISPLTLADYASTSGMTLRAENNVWINAPIIEYNANFVENPEYTLRTDNEQLYLSAEHDEFSVDFIPIPNYHNQTLSDGTPVIEIAASHGDRLRLTPVDGCAYKCDFCNIPFDRKYRMRSIEQLTEATQIAMGDTALRAEHVLISGGVPRDRDFGKELEFYKYIIHNNPDIDIDIMMAPVPELLNPEQLKQIGANGLSINMELWNTEIANKLIYGKVKLSRKQYLSMIEKSVESFGKGAIRSALLVGLEPIEDTLKGVRALAERGCDPMLSPFRPDPATPLSHLKPPMASELLQVYERSLEIISEFDGVKLGPRCIPCGHNTMVIPDNSGLYYYSKRKGKNGQK